MADKKPKAIVLAGGLGTRLRPYTLFLPKPMLPLGDKPVLEHIVEWLKNYSITSITISLSYLGRVIQDHLKDGRDLGVKIDYVRTARPMGTAGQLKVAARNMKDTFICLYGDSVFSFDIGKMLEFHRSNGATVTMALTSFREVLKYGFIDLDDSGKVKLWREKPEVSGLINIGFYVMESGFLSNIPNGKRFGMDEAFQIALNKRQGVFGYKVEGEFIDIGDRKKYHSAYDMYLRKLGVIP